MIKFKTLLHESWQLKPDKGVPHIEHVHHLQADDTERATKFSLNVLHDVHSRLQGKPGDPSLRYTGKVDDRMSTKVAKVQGKVSVGYKGHSAPLLHSQQEIDHTYSDKPHVHQALSHLLQHAHKIIPHDENNVQYQVGLIHSGDSSAISKREGGSVTPNTITYKYKSPKQTAKIGVSVISKTHLDNNGKPKSMTQNFDIGKHGSHPDVEVMDNKIDFTKSSAVYHPEHQKQFEHHYNQAVATHQQMSKSGHYSALEGHHENMQAYLNSHIRSGTAASNDHVTGYKQFLNNTGEKEAAKVKRPESKIAKQSAYSKMSSHVDNHKEAFSNAFNLMHHLKSASQSMSHALSHATFPTVDQSINGKKVHGEGMVVSRDNKETGAMETMKLVPHEFTAANFARSAKFKKK